MLKSRIKSPFNPLKLEFKEQIQIVLNIIKLLIFSQKKKKKGINTSKEIITSKII